MSYVVEQLTALREALIAGGLRVHRVGDPLDPPAVLIEPPSLTWVRRGPAPSEATFRVAVVIAADDREAERATELALSVAALVDGLRGFVVRSAEPDRVKSGSTELPCFMINIEVAL